MKLNIEQIKADIKEKGFDISYGDIAAVFIYKLTSNKACAYALGHNKDKWNLQSSYSASTTYFKNPKIILLMNYLEPIYLDFARDYLTSNMRLFVDIIDTKRNFNPANNLSGLVSAEGSGKKSREELELLLNQLLTTLDMKENAKTIADIAVQLAKNFQPETVEYNQVIVEEKYNDICPYCNHEISVRREKIK